MVAEAEVICSPRRAKILDAAVEIPWSRSRCAWMSGVVIEPCSPRVVVLLPPGTLFVLTFNVSRFPELFMIFMSRGSGRRGWGECGGHLTAI